VLTLGDNEFVLNAEPALDQQLAPLGQAVSEPRQVSDAVEVQRSVPLALQHPSVCTEIAPVALRAFGLQRIRFSPSIWNGEDVGMARTLLGVLSGAERRSRVAVCLASAAVVLTATAAAATGAWTVQETPNPRGGHALLLGVSCWSASGCIAVGDSNNFNGTTFAESWNGSTWTLLKTASPRRSELRGVSCWSANGCEAVGHDSGGGVTVAERWNGSSWTLQKLPNALTVDAVSCWSANGCIAVGGLYGEGPPHADRWNGRSWIAQKVAGPPGGGVFGGVSCSSASECIAVGSNNSNKTLAERWNGHSWTLQKTPTPLSGGSFYGVSCWSANGCEAVGTSSGYGGETIGERWNGSSWTLQKTPSPQDSVLGAVSCWAGNGCIAVGEIPRDGSGLAELWDGSSWTLQDGVTAGYSVDVSCWSDSGCAAVGYTLSDDGHKTNTLAEGWSPR
jgi:hypothetical protein